MHLGSIYLVVKDYDKSLNFYEKLLEMKVTHQNSNRFAMFEFEGHCIALLNGHFDSDNPDKVVRKGTYDPYFDDYKDIMQLDNSRKTVLNFWHENLLKENQRLKELHISERITDIKYICNASPYYYFQLSDPDGNVIEVTGNYDPS